MGKKKVTRVLSLMMALLLVVSSTVLAVGASGGSSVTDKRIEDYISMSGVRTYDEYMAQEFGNAQSATRTGLRDRLRPHAGRIRHAMV